jgi:hypothetical protein
MNKPMSNMNKEKSLIHQEEAENPSSTPDVVEGKTEGCSKKQQYFAPDDDIKPDFGGHTVEEVFYHVFGPSRSTYGRRDKTTVKCQECRLEMSKLDLYPAGCIEPKLGYELLPNAPLLTDASEITRMNLSARQRDHLGQCEPCHLEVGHIVRANIEGILQEKAEQDGTAGTNEQIEKEAEEIKNKIMDTFLIEHKLYKEMKKLHRSQRIVDMEASLPWKELAACRFLAALIKSKDKWWILSDLCNEEDKLPTDVEYKDLLSKELLVYWSPYTYFFKICTPDEKQALMEFIDIIDRRGPATNIDAYPNKLPPDHWVKLYTLTGLPLLVPKVEKLDAFSVIRRTHEHGDRWGGMYIEQADLFLKERGMLQNIINSICDPCPEQKGDIETIIAQQKKDPYRVNMTLGRKVATHAFAYSSLDVPAEGCWYELPIQNCRNCVAVLIRNNIVRDNCKDPLASLKLVQHFPQIFESISPHMLPENLLKHLKACTACKHHFTNFIQEKRENLLRLIETVKTS